MPMLTKYQKTNMEYTNVGGHTAEMLTLVEGIDKAFYSPRVYVAAETDAMSAKRALSREQTWSQSQVTQRSIGCGVPLAGSGTTA